MSAGHALIAPSGLARLIQCAGSLVMQAAYPEIGEAIDAAEGEASHWALAELLAGRTPVPGQQAPNKIFLTKEMIDGAEVCADDVIATAEQYGVPMDQVIVEVAVSVQRIHREHCWGTPDVRMWVPRMKLLIVWDYKFGRRFVPVFENPQLIAYTVGCIDQAGLHDQEVSVINRIVQPRSYHPSGTIREWRYNAAEVRGLVNIANMAAVNALGPDPVTRVGTECRDCTARNACPTLLRAAEDACEVSGKAQPMALPPEALGVELRYVNRALSILKARQSGLEEQALALLRRGERVPHFKVGHGGGRKVWKKPDAEVIAMGRLLNLDLAKAPDAITPNQAVKAGLPAALLDTFAEQLSGAAALVADDGADLRQVFSQSA